MPKLDWVNYLYRPGNFKHFIYSAFWPLGAKLHVVGGLIQVFERNARRVVKKRLLTL